jgi:hypothetical protein
MNPLIRLYRRSRPFRVCCYVSMALLWVLIQFIAEGSFEKYSYVGNMILLAAVMFFALWAWWYGEDRDRRRAAKTATHSGDVPSADGDGHRSAAA